MVSFYTVSYNCMWIYLKIKGLTYSVLVDNSPNLIEEKTVLSSFYTLSKVKHIVEAEFKVMSATHPQKTQIYSIIF